MEYWDLFEVSEIEELIDKSERKYSFTMLNPLDDSAYPMCSIGALSPHLSDDQDEPKSVINKPVQKPVVPSKHKSHDTSVRIGTLTYEERQIKLKKYREKKKNRVWSKKINYNCRKKVAEGRLRVKGRFVTKEQALVLQKLHEDEEPWNQTDEH